MTADSYTDYSTRGFYMADTDAEAPLVRRDYGAVKCANPHCDARGTVRIRGEFCAVCRDQYRAWRDTIPFTDDQIADALLEAKSHDLAARTWKARAAWWDRSAAWVRSGHLTSKLLGLALAFMVKACTAPEGEGACGRKALYRLGKEGRCSRHRDVKTSWSAAYAAKLEAKRSAIDTRENELDRSRRAKDDRRKQSRKHASLSARGRN